jgi:hypothetical protein
MLKSSVPTSQKTHHVSGDYCLLGCSLHDVYRRFGVTYCLHLRGREARQAESSKALFSWLIRRALKMADVRSSKRGNLLPNYTETHPTRQYSSLSTPWNVKPETGFFITRIRCWLQTRSSGMWATTEPAGSSDTGFHFHAVFTLLEALSERQLS